MPSPPACRCLMGLLLLISASGFHLSVSTGQNAQGAASTEVTVQLGDHDDTMRPEEGLGPIMDQMQTMANHMDQVFGSSPFDLKSFFSDPFKHLRAMEHALFGPHRAHSHFNGLLHHLKNHPEDPRSMVAAACHCMLHKCISKHPHRLWHPHHSWQDAYKCLLNHRASASPKCQAVLSHAPTKNLLGEDSSTKPDQNGCWRKQTGTWCPGTNGGWVRKRHKPTKSALKHAQRNKDLKGEATPGYLMGDVEAPLGSKDMGGWVAKVYTDEQQKRLRVDEFGQKLAKLTKFSDHPVQTPPPTHSEDEKALDGIEQGLEHLLEHKVVPTAQPTLPPTNSKAEKALDGIEQGLEHLFDSKLNDDGKKSAFKQTAQHNNDLKGEATPGYLTGDVEAPLGSKDMGGWVAKVYTDEQQKRLHVDEFGQIDKSSNKKIEIPHSTETKESSDAGWAGRLHAFVSHFDHKMIPVMAVLVVLVSAAFMGYCCKSKPKETLDRQYEVLLQSDVVKDATDQL